MSNHYKLGSEWRIWDLQVQTILDDRYISLESYYEALKAECLAKWQAYTDLIGGEENALNYDSKQYFFHGPDDKETRCRNYVRNTFAFLSVYHPNLGCIGITDHNYWDDQLLDTFFNYSRINKIKSICGVEINVAGVHILVFFKKPPCRQQSFSQGITTFLQENHIYNHKTDGVLTVSDKSIAQVLNSIRKEKGIYIFPHCNSNNGLFQERTKTDRTYLGTVFNAKKRILLQCNAKDSADKIDGYIKTHTGGLFKSKAILTITPDSRCLNDIGKADTTGNYCWIKSNPGFTGLEQIIYEPELRLYLGPTPPNKIQKSKIIKSITVSNSNGWFNEPLSLSFNESQVSLIGGKGSGKTALLDLIAFAAGSFDYNETSFLSRSAKSRSGTSISGTNINLEWFDGTIDSATIPSLLPKKTDIDFSNTKLLYLSQNYVERLCSFDQIEELNKQIEAVIFQKVPKENKSGYNNFHHYKEDKIGTIAKEKQRYANEINNENETIHLYRTQINKESDIQSRKKGKIDELTQLLKEYQEAAASTPKSEAKLKRLQDLKEQTSSLELSISTLDQSIQKARGIQYSINEFKKSASAFADTLKIELSSIEIEVLDSISIQFLPENIYDIIHQKIAERDLQSEALRQHLEDKRTETNACEDELKLEKDKNDNLILLSDRITKYKDEISALENELNTISLFKNEIINITDSRKSSFINFLSSLKNERAVLKQIYAPIEKDLATAPEQNTGLLSFVVTSNFDLEKMLADGESIIDHSKTGNFFRKDSGYLRGELTKLSFELIFEDTNGHMLSNEEFTKTNLLMIDGYLSGIQDLLSPNIESQLRKGATHQDFDKWLFSVDVFKVGYSIHFNKTPLTQLSPGMKGMALLILYLELDHDDSRPILIDQPEENLDNRSVYETLRGYFRRTKKRRQIMIATHNPNLVVNTDSEQVIVANFSRNKSEQPSTISYVSGALECDFSDPTSTEVLEIKSIKEHICHILEGGEDAFKQRELRYGLL